jgi:hypothetical protein
MRPVVRQRARLSLGRVTVLATLVPVLVLSWSATPAGAAVRSASGSASSSALPTTADDALEAVMLATPLPGLVDFTLVGPGATNGVLTAQTMASYSDDPTQVEQLFDQYSAESGFAGWIKTWQDATGTDRVVEIAIRFHDSTEASTNSAAFVATLSKGQPNGTHTVPPSIPGASAFTINEPATTSGNLNIPAQQVQAVVYSDADYLVVIHTDSSVGTGSHPIADGTAMALALQQYQDLAQSVSTPKHSAQNLAKVKATKGGSTTRTVGVILLCAVALVIAAFALVTWRRRRRVPTPTESARPTAPPVPVSPRSSSMESPTARSGTERKDTRRIARSTTGQHVQKPDPRRSTEHRRGRLPARPSRQRPDGDRLVGVAARSGRASRSQRLDSSRTKHPSAAVVLAHARPKNTAAGWYEDPSDGDHRRIRYWDGSSWTAHVAEPET